MGFKTGGEEMNTIDPINVLKVRMEDLGLKQKDLIKYIGSQGGASSILNRKRKLSKAIVKRLFKAELLTNAAVLGWLLDIKIPKRMQL